MTPRSSPGVMVTIPEGRYRIGADRFYPEEAPLREVRIASFRIALAPVTNAEFTTFVASTGYVTAPRRSSGSRPPPWFSHNHPAWINPCHGPRSTLVGLVAHPVVHINGANAQAYCAGAAWWMVGSGPRRWGLCRPRVTS